MALGGFGLEGGREALVYIELQDLPSFTFDMPCWVVAFERSAERLYR